MGPDSKNNGTLYLRSEETGEYIPFSGLTDVMPFFKSECVNDDETKYMLASKTIATFTVTIHGKDFGRMTAKRFKKILISRGISRDDADFLCYLVGWFKGRVSYHEAYWGALFLRPAARFYEVFDYIMTKGEISEWTNIKQQMSLI